MRCGLQEIGDGSLQHRKSIGDRAAVHASILKDRYDNSGVIHSAKREKPKLPGRNDVFHNRSESSEPKAQTGRVSHSSSASRSKPNHATQSAESASRLATELLVAAPLKDATTTGSESK